MILGVTMSDTNKNAASIACEPLTGSSKRKRKSTIVKRSVSVEEKTSSKTTEEVETEDGGPEAQKICDNKVEQAFETAEKEDRTKRSKRSTTSLCGKKEVDCAEGDSQSVSEDELFSKKDKRKTSRITDEKPSHKCKSCNLCHDHMSLKQLKEELKIESKMKKKFSCDACSNEGRKRTYNSKEKLDQHITHSHKEKNTLKFECKLCEMTTWFPSKSKLSYHMSSKHPGVLVFICEVCTETFKLKTNYKSHIKTHNIVVHKKFECTICGGTFVNKAGFLLHKKRFPGPHIQQSCEHCGFSFSKESHIKNHRCKKLLMEEAEKARELAQHAAASKIPEVTQCEPPPENCETVEIINAYHLVKEADAEETTTSQATSSPPVTYYKATSDENEESDQLQQQVVLATEDQPQIYYRPVQVQTQNLQESVVLQEFRGVTEKNGVGSENERTIIIRDINGHVNVCNSQIFQAVDINDIETSTQTQQSQQQQVFHVSVADWNVVGPYVIK